MRIVRNRLGVAVLLLGLTTAPLSAAPQAYDWSGLYLGRNAGGWDLGLGVNFAGGSSSNKYDQFPALSGVGPGGGGNAFVRYYFLPGFFAGVDAGVVGTDIKAFNPDTGVFADYNWQAWQTLQGGFVIPPGPARPPITIFVGGGVVEGGVRAGVNLGPMPESNSTTLTGFTVRSGVEAPVTSNISLGLIYSFSQFNGRLGGDPISTQVNMVLLNATWHFGQPLYGVGAR